MAGMRGRDGNIGIIASFSHKGVSYINYMRPLKFNFAQPTRTVWNFCYCMRAVGTSAD